MISSASTPNDSLERLDRSQLLQLVEALEALKERQDTNRLAAYAPYTKQAEFHKNGATDTERLLMAGNQLGKTYCGAAEVSFHLTGKYPDWWEGRRWDRPTRWWAG